MEIILIILTLATIAYLVWCTATYESEPENFIGEHVDFSFVNINKNYETAYHVYVHEGIILQQSTLRRFLKLPWLQIYHFSNDGHRNVWFRKDLSQMRFKSPKFKNIILKDKPRCLHIEGDEEL